MFDGNQDYQQRSPGDKSDNQNPGAYMALL
jgi:hypothetical protein